MSQPHIRVSANSAQNATMEGAYLSHHITELLVVNAAITILVYLLQDVSDFSAHIVPGHFLHQRGRIEAQHIQASSLGHCMSISRLPTSLLHVCCLTIAASILNEFRFSADVCNAHRLVLLNVGGAS